MATITKRESGKWQAKIRIGGNIRSATFRTKGEATSWANSLENEISAVRAGNTPNRTVGEMLEKYIIEELPKKRGERQDTLRMRRIQRDHLLADISLRDIQPSDIAEWRDRRLDKVSSASVLRELSTLSHSFTVAMKEWGWIRLNPCHAINKPDTAPPRTRRYTQDEIDRLLLACGYDHNEKPLTIQSRVGSALLFAFETGMRAGEIVGIKPEHIDIERRIVHLPKTKNGHPRDVPLSREAIRLLEQLDGIAAPGKPVFAISSGSLDALFRKARERAMIEGVRFHDSRAEGLTRLAKKLSPMELAKVSGHRDLRILLNTYYREDPASLADKLD
ncbi:site-specific integrase [Chitinibacter fontanus]|uniref:Site-specific integrase n=1 Tax=Chitinibacter fontanus TaxID=1737446 RepID=A0A7D5V8P3_9NEIS|nr:site-specific integrase [Chitinibacter fontanus]QLI80774.1 site-specific integrase [Chitinibacter fontanus]